MEIDGIILEEMPNNTLRFYMSDNKRRGAAMGNIGGFVFGAFWTAMSAYFSLTAFNQNRSTGQVDYVLLAMTGFFVLIGLLILYYSAVNFLTETYGSDMWYASNDNLLHETSLWGRTSRKTYTCCQFKIDRVYDKNGAYRHSNLVAHSKKPLKYVIVDNSVDNQRLTQLGDALGKYTGWGWDDVQTRII